MVKLGVKVSQLLKAGTLHLVGEALILGYLNT